jgi:hypothetical protein
MVREPVDEIVQRALAYRHRLLQGPGVRDGLADLAAALERHSNADDPDKG